MEENVIQFINQDLYTEHKATEYDEFQYNMEDDSSFNDLKNVFEKIENLETSHNNVNSCLENLCTGVYAQKVEICAELRNYSNLIHIHLGDIKKTINDMTEALKEVLEDQVRSDAELIDDLGKISGLLGEEFDASKYESQGAGGASGTAPSTTGESATDATDQSSGNNEELTATTESVQAETAMAGPAPQEVQTLTQDNNATPASTGSAEQAQTPTAEAPGGNPQPQSAPAPASTNVNDAEAASALGISEQELDVVKAVIRHEAGNNPQEMLNVASAVKNRMNSGGGSPYAVLTAKGQFSSYGGGHYKQYVNGNYYQGDAATKANLDNNLNAILLGKIPPTHGYSNFRSKDSPNGVQLAEGGNKYR